MSSRNVAPLALMRFARARVYDWLLTTPPRPLGSTNRRRRKQLKPWRVKSAMASPGFPSTSRKVTPRCSAWVRAEMSAPSRNDGRDDGAEEEARVVAAAGVCARVRLESMRQTSKPIGNLRMGGSAALTPSDQG